MTSAAQCGRLPADHWSTADNLRFLPYVKFSINTHVPRLMLTASVLDTNKELFSLSFHWNGRCV